MRKLLVYLRDYKKETILGPLFKLLEASFELLVPLVVASMIDVGIARGEAGTGHILRMGAVLLALAVIGLTCSLTAQYFSAKAAVGFSGAIRSRLFAHIQSLSFSEMDQVGSSTFITRMTSDINQVQTGVNLTLRLFLRSPFIVFGAMIMAFTIDVKSALIFVVVIPLLSVIVFGIMLLQIPVFKKVQTALDHVLLDTKENLSGVRVIRAFHKEETEIEQFCEDNGALYTIQMFAGKLSALLNPLTYVIINGGLVFLIWYGSRQVDGGILIQGSLIALINYMSQILTELVKLADLIINITKSIACGNRIQSVFEISPTMKYGSDEGAAELSDEVLRFDHVSFRYPNGGDEALKNIDFSVKRGETIGIIGGTGSGKSTLVHLASRFYDATAGEVRLLDAPITSYTEESLRKHVSIVMQKAVLFRGTIRSNLLWGKADATEEEMWNALSVAQAKEFVVSKARGLDEPVEQEGRNFSGGQRQRINIARSVIAGTELLILDDSASALDYATDAKLRASLKSLGGSITTMIVSQRTASIQHADRILVLDEGMICGMGTHQELLATCEVYREIYESQFKKKEA